MSGIWSSHPYDRTRPGLLRYVERDFALSFGAVLSPDHHTDRHTLAFLAPETAHVQ